MTTFFILLFVVAVVALILNKKATKPLKLVGNVKKVEAAVAKVGEVATNALDVNGDGKVDIQDVKAVAQVVKKTRKPRAKKNTPKKGK